MTIWFILFVKNKNNFFHKQPSLDINLTSLNSILTKIKGGAKNVGQRRKQQQKRWEKGLTKNLFWKNTSFIYLSFHILGWNKPGSDLSICQNCLSCIAFISTSSYWKYIMQLCQHSSLVALLAFGSRGTWF